MLASVDSSEKRSGIPVDMAVQLSTIFNTALSYPVVSCGLLLLLAFPVFQLLVYFFPLFISTALCVLALVTVGPSFHRDEEPSSKQASSLADDSSWLGRVRYVQERARAWVDSKLTIKDRSVSSLQEDGDDDDDDLRDSEQVSMKTEHEKRVHQLERTLRTLSFVSLEGIFESDAALLEMDDTAEEKVNLSVENGEVLASDEDEEVSVQAEANHSEAPPPAKEQQDDQSETSSNGSSSWQEVEHTRIEQEQ